MNANQNIVGRGKAERTRFHLDGRSVKLDRRVNAVRGDLADFSLAGVLFAPHYAKAEAMHCLSAAAFVREAGAADAVASSQLLPGETFHLFDVTGGWAWGFCDHDGYVGYVERAALSVGMLPATHHVIARSAPLFSAPDIKSPVAGALPAGARIAGVVEGDFIVTEAGAVHSRHVLPLGAFEADWVAAAERQIGQPYVWGGRGADGLDCSGLVQLALGQAGVKIPRDSDLQRESIGDPLPEDAPLQRGDVIFFPGHVGIMVDAHTMLHANAFWMTTLIEPLADVIARLAPAHDQPVLSRQRVSL
ncbi:MAG: C40 family peptidase [Sphingobium sp.]|nr:C40 family peptidase [Sphingobium sp.]MBP6111772.1 C40 family peptidase [Sphingobium sp.]MBP8671256.1 C40 family peptidase [Sphingobium sp.]MBP9156321.1 C40 family peptidase [Sphingobium sp.]